MVKVKDLHLSGREKSPSLLLRKIFWKNQKKVFPPAIEE